MPNTQGFTILQKNIYNYLFRKFKKIGTHIGTHIFYLGTHSGTHLGTHFINSRYT